MNESDETTDTPKELTSSGKWSDMGDDFVDGGDPDRWEAPVLWIKRTYKAPQELIESTIIRELQKAGIENPQIISMHITSNPGRDHAYLLLSSKKASELLIDGTVSIVVPHVDEEMKDKEDAVLWFDKADHLEPTEKQDPFVLYIWQLPKSRTVTEIDVKLRDLLSSWCPLISLEIGSSDDGKTLGWAKAHFGYEFDTQKAIYLLNFNSFMGAEVRAAFCVVDRFPSGGAARKPRGGPRTEKKCSDNPRPRNKSNSKIAPKKKSPPQRSRAAQAPVASPPEAAAVPTTKNSKGGDWKVVGREGRK